MPGAAAVTPRELTDAAPQIESITARAVIAPLARPIRTAVGEIPAAPLVLIDVRTRRGRRRARLPLRLHARSRCAPLTQLRRRHRRGAAGRRSRRSTRMREFDRRFRLLGWQGFVGMAVSGLDMALWDALARAVDQPLAALLGGTPSAAAGL